MTPYASQQPGVSTAAVAMARDDATGLMQRSYASINDMLIQASERKRHRPLGIRPDDHSGLTERGL